MNKWLLLLGAVIAIASLAGFAYAADKTFGTRTTSHTSTISQPVREVVIEANVGDVALVRGDGRVTVHEKRRRHGARTRQTLRDGVLTLASDCHGSWLRACGTGFRVELPAGVALRVKTNAGDVRAEAIESPAVRVRTNAGDIELDLARAPSRVEADTNVGDVDIAVPGGAYAVDAGTTIGDREVAGLVEDASAARSISARSDVGDLTVRAR